VIGYARSQSLNLAYFRSENKVTTEERTVGDREGNDRSAREEQDVVMTSGGVSGVCNIRGDRSTYICEVGSGGWKLCGRNNAQAYLQG